MPWLGSVKHSKAGLACDTPVISSDGGVLPEILGDAGITVAAADAPALGKAISELLKGLAHRKAMGESCRERIKQGFSWKVAAEQFGQYYLEMLMECWPISWAALW